MYGQYLVCTLYYSLTVGIAKFNHLVDQVGYATSILDYLLVDILACRFVESHIRHSDNLGETAQDVEWCTDFVADLTDKVRLHLR